MQVLKPGEAILDETEHLLSTEANRQHLEQSIAQLRTMLAHVKQDDPFGHLTGLDKLSAQLSDGSLPLRNKQGIFKPRKLVVILAFALRFTPPPALVVQFDRLGQKTTFPMALQ